MIIGVKIILKNHLFFPPFCPYSGGTTVFSAIFFFNCLENNIFATSRFHGRRSLSEYLIFYHPKLFVGNRSKHPTKSRVEPSVGALGRTSRGEQFREMEEREINV